MFNCTILSVLLPVVALLVIAIPPAEATYCIDMVLMHHDTGNSVCVDEDYVESMMQFGFYIPDIPLPTVVPGEAPSHACSSYNYRGTFDTAVLEETLSLASPESQFVTTSSTESTAGTSSPLYSTTNIQEAKVDEPDIIKNTATDIFVSGSQLNVIQAYPPDGMAVVGHSPITGPALLHEDRLAVFNVGGDTKITILNVSDRTNPQILDRILITGTMTEARLINNTIYVITQDSSDRIPVVKYGTDAKSPDTHYFPFYMVDTRTMITAVSLESGFEAISFLTPFNMEIYVSESNMYLVMPGTGHSSGISWPPDQSTLGAICATDTQVVKIGLSGTGLSYQGAGTVPGYPINQFAMAEKDNTFRIATTTRSGVNSAFKFDSNLDMLGAVYDIAPGETMHSARFYGDTLYLVTFRQVDPFFVIDFSESPMLVGELKLPGFSEYLHPYDEDTVVGVGRETIEAQWGPVIDGIKVTVFDVSDPANPTLSDFDVIDDRDAYSEVQRDHKAALISTHIISIPVIHDGATTFHVYNIENNILVKKGIVKHDDTDWARSLYIGDYLYTVTPGLLKVTDLNGFVPAGQIILD